MKLLTKSLGLLLTLTLLAPALAKSDKHRHNGEIVKFVQGGAPSGGTGTKKHPFATLKEAAASTWDVLIVLPSAVALTDGITLTNQKLIGDICDSKVAVFPKLTTNAVNVIGDGAIENIFFTSMLGSAINYDKAENLIVKNVTIDGFDLLDTQASAITGTCPQSGKALIENVTIRNDKSSVPAPVPFSAGIFDAPTGSGVSRELTVCGCELTTITKNGIETAPDKGASSNVVIKDSYLHDFNNKSANGISANGINVNLGATKSSTETLLVKNVSFYNVGAPAGNEIRLALNNASNLQARVDSCSFTETESENGKQNVIVIFSVNTSSSSEIVVENSVSTNVDEFYADTLSSAIKQDNRFYGNTVSVTIPTLTGGTFYEAGIKFGGTGNTGKSAVTTDIKGNIFNGTTGIQIDPPSSGGTYSPLYITAEHNCFTGTGQAFLTTATGNIGTAIIDAHCNSFSGFNPDIKDAGSNVAYLVSSNFWGPLQPCTGTTCPASQICQNGFCLGPTTSLGTPFLGFLDASDPLAVSIKCPKTCHSSDI